MMYFVQLVVLAPVIALGEADGITKSSLADLQTSSNVLFCIFAMSQ